MLYDEERERIREIVTRTGFQRPSDNLPGYDPDNASYSKDERKLASPFEHRGMQIHKVEDLDHQVLD